MLVQSHDRNKKIFDIINDSPNGYNIVKNAPAVTHSIDNAVKYYSFQLRQFTPEYPDEYGVIHFTLGEFIALTHSLTHSFIHSLTFTQGKLYMNDKRAEAQAAGSMGGNLAEGRAKNIENAIFHFRRAIQVFTYYSHPVQFAVLCTMIGQMFRERAILYQHRYFVARSGKPGTHSLTPTHFIANPHCYLVMKAKPYKTALSN